MTPAEQLDLLLEKLDLGLAAFARELEVPVQQLKDIKRGRTQKFSREVSMALVEKFQVDPAWLNNGGGAMLRRAGPDTDAAVELALRYVPLSQALLADMCAVSSSAWLSSDALAVRFQDQLPQATFAQNELTLLEHYRTASDHDKRAIERFTALAAVAAAKPADVKSAPQQAQSLLPEAKDGVKLLVATYLNASKEARDLIILTACCADDIVGSRTSDMQVNA
jgi:hypothetical protein